MDKENKAIGEVFEVIKDNEEVIIYVRLPAGFKVDYFQKVTVSVVADEKDAK